VPATTRVGVLSSCRLTMMTVLRMLMLAVLALLPTLIAELATR
jgi:hypothetical protein